MNSPVLMNVLRPEYDVKKPAKKFVVGYTEQSGDDAGVMLVFLDSVMRMGYKIKVSAMSDALKKGVFELEKRDKKRCSVIDIDVVDDKIWKKADVMVFGAEVDENMIKKCADHGVVPIVPNGGIINNFNPQKESGEGFTFEEGNFWEMIDALVRAAENRKFSYDWGNIKKALKKLV